MAAALPVVASNVGQLGKLIVHGVNGLLVPAGDAVALAGALVCLRNEPALRARLGEAARAEMLNRHTWDGVVDRILRVVHCDLPAKSGCTCEAQSN